MKALIHYTTPLTLVILLLATGCGEDSDNTPPAVIRTIPANRAADVQLNTSIEVKFSEVIDPGSIDGAIETWPAINGVVTRDEGQSLIFSPQQNLIPCTEYLVTVSGVRDSTGNEMKAYTFSFTSGEEDNVPPRVVETTPMPNEEDVLEDMKYITIKFSERLDRTRTYNAFHIRGSMSGEIEIWKAKWLDSVTYQLKLHSGFENEEEVVVKVDRSCIADPLGNEMAEDYAFSFTIEGINPVGRPRSYSQRLLSYSIWQGTSGEWHIRWNANWVQGAPPMYQTSPSQPVPDPEPKPKPKPSRPSHPDQHTFSGTIVSDGILTAELDPYSFSDNDVIQMEVRENLVKVTADEVIVERNEANVVTVKADEIIIDGELGDMVSVTEDAVMIEGDIVAIADKVVTVEGSVLTVRGDTITVRGDAGSVIVVEGKVLNVAGNVVVLEGEVKSLTGSALVVEGDVIVVQGGRIWFAGFTGINDSGDGFDFRSDGLFLTFDIQIDNEYRKSNVYIGEKSKHPRDIPFDLKSRYPYSGINGTYGD